jgi:hypothetical protein
MTKKVDNQIDLRPSGPSPYSAAREIRLTAGGGDRQFKGHRRMSGLGQWEHDAFSL